MRLPSSHRSPGADALANRSGDDGGTSGLTHIDRQGRARMVDVTGKPLTRRVAVAKCAVVTTVDTQNALISAPPDGIDIVEAARFAGILAAKQTASLIPLCHPIRLDGVSVEVSMRPRGFDVRAVTEIVERTGVEMEALTACAVAALALVQALVEVDPTASIEDLTLWHKSGGRSGNWERSGPDALMTHQSTV
jgi:cyclic pyranopterin monophosphate synthase